MADNSGNLDVILVDLEEDADDFDIIEVVPPDVLPQEQEQQQEEQQEKEQQEPEQEEQEQELETSEITESSTPQNPQSSQKKAIQQCLALLLHAQRCDIVQEKTSEVQIQCIQPHCSTIKALLTHSKTCKTPQTCNQPRCTSSKMLLRHWDTCKRSDCPLCSPLRRRFNIQTHPAPQKSRDSRRISKTSTPKSSNPKLLPNPFAQLKRTRDLPGDNWDDEPIVEFEQISSDPSACVHVQAIGLSAGNRPKPSNFEWVSSSGSQRWKSRKNFGADRELKHRNSFKTRGRGGFNKKKGEKYFRRPSAGVCGDEREIKGNFEGNLEVGGVMNTREQMLMLVHAFKCRRREESGVGGCTNATCKSTKNLLEHMKRCERTVNCWIPRCISSKRILIHVNECRDDMCVLCAPSRGSITQ